MGILHVTKKKVPDVLTRRLLQQLRILDNAMLENLEDDVEKNFSPGKVYVHDTNNACGRPI